ncbi:MAG TPA: hypothetical protein DCK93_15910 [Blastocatellia bacterium]|nr:hypothetical protein [Blastocatellia bacterium]
MSNKDVVEMLKSRDLPRSKVSSKKSGRSGLSGEAFIILNYCLFSRIGPTPGYGGPRAEPFGTNRGTKH